MNIILAIVGSVLFTIYVAPADFGLMALSTTIIGFIGLLKDFGFSSYIIQQPNITDDELVSINSNVLLLSVAAFVVICLLAIPVSGFYKQVQLLWILPLTGMHFILNAFTLVPQALMRRNMEFDKIGKIDVSSKFISVAVGIGMLLFIRNYWVLLVVSVLFSVIQIAMTYRYSSWKFRIANPFRKKMSKASASFGKRLTAFNIMTFVSINLDTVLIGKLAGNEVLGNYNKAVEFGNTNVDRLIRRPVMQVFFSDLSGKEVNEKCRLFYQYLILLLTLLLLVAGPGMICAEWLINNFLNNRWHQLSLMLPPILLCSFFWMTRSLADQLLIATTKLKRYLFLGVSMSIIGSVSIVIASFWGAQAIAWSFLIYNLLFFIPFCFSVFSGIELEAGKAKAMIIDVTILVFSAGLVTFVPYILSHYHYISIKLALLLFVCMFFILHFVIWPNIMHYQSFKSFFKGLIKLRVAKAA